MSVLLILYFWFRLVVNAYIWQIKIIRKFANENFLFLSSAPNDKMKEVLRKTMSEAKKIVSKVV